ncbi:lysylphosphatidylglycerol synthase transmembrane domain-containing protein [Bacillus sp. KH172YL63]|uniref:lysylphosphatidylglycerol synthase transmembrane domain-containing protein n=1 Tax=Bacillus sp. KH172YL63 TaxID=2709784 RepID=UPI0013E46682|nr:lysylphosphatidylglycerol synthase transmembrane domain-containing protein [Bacillus sp. KH172YL63]BCB05058.1 hypothetical protein KH172YL63_31910 [Bacillus sp. KH172YL63]
MSKAYYKLAINGVRILLFGLFILLVSVYLDKESLMETGRRVLANPGTITVVLGIYFLSFLLKGLAWKMYLKGSVRLSSCLIGLFYSLLFNHLLPLKVGDGLRVMVMHHRENVTVEKSFHSVFVLRVIDTLSLLFLIGLGLPFFSLSLEVPGLYSLIILGSLVTGGGFLLWKVFPRLLARQLSMLKDALSGVRGIGITGLVLGSWILEGAVLFGVGSVMYHPLSAWAAIWVNSVTIAGQMFQFAPGGIGTYESIMSYALLSIGIPLKDGLSMALFSHGLKFLFSYIAGGIVIALAPVSIAQMKRWIRMKG